MGARARRPTIVPTQPRPAPAMARVQTAEPPKCDCCLPHSRIAASVKTAVVTFQPCSWPHRLTPHHQQRVHTVHKHHALAGVALRSSKKQWPKGRVGVRTPASWSPQLRSHAQRDVQRAPSCTHAQSRRAASRPSRLPHLPPRAASQLQFDARRFVERRADDQKAARSADLLAVEGALLWMEGPREHRVVAVVQGRRS